MALENAEELLEQVRGAWRPFEEAVRRAEAEAATDRQLPSGWTVREMLGHVAFWDEAVVGAVTGMIRGQPMPEGWAFGSGYVPTGEWPRADVHNAREGAWARAQEPAIVLSRLWNAHAKMDDFLRTVTADELREHQDYFAQLGGHYREHLPDLSG